MIMNVTDWSKRLEKNEWLTQKGELFSLDSMTEAHIIKCIVLMNKKLETYAKRELYKDTNSILENEEPDLENEAFKALIQKQINAFSNELNLRKIN